MALIRAYRVLASGTIMRFAVERLSVILLLIQLTSLAGCVGSPTRHGVDLLVVGGTVYNGANVEPSVTDVGIIGDKIVFIGDASKAHIRSKKTLNAKGMMVMPGLIDAHTHTDEELSSSNSAQRLVPRQVLQGITTSIIGVDGDGTPDLKAEFAKMEQMGIGQNVAAYVGFGAIRERVLQRDARVPTPAELQTMKSLAANGMCEGAIGLSSGLFYAPQSFASTEEVIAIAKEAGERGGVYDTHQRDEGSSSVGIVTSLKEAIRIGEESGAPLHVAHIKVTNSSRPDGEDMAEVIAMIEAARAKGQNVTADQYPWTAANTGLDAVAIPRWAQAGGFADMIKRFDSPADLAKIRADSGLTPALAQKIMISEAPKQPELIGKRLSELANQWGVDQIDAAIRVLKGGEAGVVVFVMTEPDIVEVMVKPWVMSSSDGGDGEHPRGYASYPRLWENYVIDQKVLTPVQFVHRSTGLEADTFGLKSRGYIKLGYFADIAVIDPKTYHARATYVEPKLLSTGIVDVIVNGGIELEDGKATGVLSGRALVKVPPAGTCP
jgi:N-acyl-D-amino-acid deacylase